MTEDGDLPDSLVVAPCQQGRVGLKPAGTAGVGGNS